MGETTGNQSPQKSQKNRGTSKRIEKPRKGKCGKGEPSSPSHNLIPFAELLPKFRQLGGTEGVTLFEPKKKARVRKEREEDNLVVFHTSV